MQASDDLMVQGVQSKVDNESGSGTAASHLSQPTLASYMGKPYTPQSARARSINRGLAEFIVRDQRPVSLIEGDGFRDFVKLLDPRYEVISRNTCMERYIVPLYQLTGNELKYDLAKAQSHSFTTDAWTNKKMQSFITTTVHYIDPDTFELKKFVLDTNHITERHTAEMLCRHMEDSEERWQLRNVTGVSDNASNITSAFQKHGIPHIGCFAHTINLAVCKGLEIDQVKRLSGKVRTLITTFKHSYLKTEDLHQNQKLLDLKELQLVQDVATRWNSVFYMFDRLLAVYPAVYASLYNSSHSHLLLNDEERKILEQLCALLAPFEKATRMISQEKQPTAGLILPYQENFVNKKLVDNQEDIPVVKRVKKAIKTDLEKRYADPTTRKLLSTTCALDPRVRTLDWMPEADKTAVYNELERLCISLSPKDDEVRNPEKRIHVQDDDDLDGLICVSSPDDETLEGEDLLESVRKELDAYKQEKSFGLKYYDSMAWWSKNQHKYPCLTRVMLNYLHIPGSSVASERIFSTAGNLYIKRLHLTPDNANIFIFLYHNYNQFKMAVHAKWASVESFNDN